MDQPSSQPIILSIPFDSRDDLKAFLRVLHAWDQKQNRPRATTDMRGSRTHLLHAAAREIRAERPELTYKDCLRLAGERLRNSQEI